MGPWCGNVGTRDLGGNLKMRLRRVNAGRGAVVWMSAGEGVEILRVQYEYEYVNSVWCGVWRHVVPE